MLIRNGWLSFLSRVKRYGHRCVFDHYDTAKEFFINNHAQLHKGTYLAGKTELGQHPAIFTSSFINKAYILISTEYTSFI